MATPVEIEVMMHYLRNSGDFRGGDFSVPEVGNAIRRLEATGMISLGPDRESRFCITEKGTVYVDALRSVPLPTPEWKIVWPKE